MYTQQECLVFSILYSELSEGRFKKPLIDHDILFYLFENSTKLGKNIFTLEDGEIDNLIEDIIRSFKGKYPRKKIDKRKDDLEKLLFNAERIKVLFELATKEMIISKNNDIEIIDYNSNRYPKPLKKLIDPPFCLFIKGRFPSDEELERSLAIVGSRKIEPNYSKKVAKSVAATLFDMGWWNISGLALGIDTHGHIGSLEKGGLTGAILGYGLNCEIYPKENMDLAKEILEKNGFLMSEIHPSRKMESFFLTQRNRLQSGLTEGIFVVSTSHNSGTLTTVKHSLSQDKFTFVWHPLGIKGYKDIEELSGNVSLVEVKDSKLFKNVKFTREDFKTIHPIKNSKELNEILRKHKKEKVISTIQKTMF